MGNAQTPRTRRPPPGRQPCAAQAPAGTGRCTPRGQTSDAMSTLVELTAAGWRRRDVGHQGDEGMPCSGVDGIPVVAPTVRDDAWPVFSMCPDGVQVEDVVERLRDVLRGTDHVDHSGPDGDPPMQAPASAARTGHRSDGRPLLQATGGKSLPGTPDHHGRQHGRDSDGPRGPRDADERVRQRHKGDEGQGERGGQRQQREGPQSQRTNPAAVPAMRSTRAAVGVAGIAATQDTRGYSFFADWRNWTGPGTG